METASPTRRFAHWVDDLPLPRLLALAGTLALMASFLRVLYDVVGTVGETVLFYPVVLVSLLAATFLARVLRATAALAVGAILFVVGIGWHTLTLDTELELLVLLSNNVELLTGETVLRIQQADVWALTVAPTPVFLTWYFALRQRYVAATLVGGSMLSYLVLTGDAGTTLTLLGVTGAGVVIAFGEIEVTGWSGAGDRAIVVLSVMVLAPLLVTVVPGGAATPVTFLDSDVSGTMEENVLTSDTSLDIVGEVNQSPEPRFRVTSEQPRLWRTGSYDRYTGSGWVRTGDATPLAESELSGPPGESTMLTQEFEVVSPLSLFPSAWQPVGVNGSITERTLVGSDGGLELDGTLPAGTSLEVRSALPDTDPETLSAAGRDYPEAIVEQYTQLPESTPDRVAQRTAQITQNAETPYETALAIEQWIETNRDYSLDVERPEGNIADSFLFEMDAGYCTYFATTMATMLRSQEIPARMVVGYSPGEPVGENEYVVRGLNSHAWVEVYFPDVGWVEFDPTPSGPRRATEQAAIGGGGTGDGTGEGGGTNGVAELSPDRPTGVVDQNQPNTSRQSPTLSEEQLPEGVQAEEGLLQPGQGASGDGDTDDGGFAVPLPSREQFAVFVIGLLGVAAWARQAGAVSGLSRRIAVRFQRRSDPETDVERAYERLMLLLEDRHRPRETGETMRQYLNDVYVSQDVQRVVELRERARYGGTVTEADADEAIELVDSIRTEGD